MTLEHPIELHSVCYQGDIPTTMIALDKFERQEDVCFECIHALERKKKEEEESR